MSGRRLGRHWAGWARDAGGCGSVLRTSRLALPAGAGFGTAEAWAQAGFAPGRDSGRRGRLGDRGAGQQLHFGVGRQQIKALRLPAGEQMQVDVVADDAGGHDRVLLVLSAELGEGVVGLGVDDRAFFNPANLVLLCLHLEEAAAVFQHFKLLAVGDLGHAVGDGGHAVVQIGLPRGDVDGIVPLGAEAAAPGTKCQQTQHEQRQDKSPATPEG